MEGKHEADKTNKNVTLLHFSSACFSSSSSFLPSPPHRFHFSAACRTWSHVSFFCAGSDVVMKSRTSPPAHVSAINRLHRLCSHCSTVCPTFPETHEAFFSSTNKSLKLDKISVSIPRRALALLKQCSKSHIHDKVVFNFFFFSLVTPNRNYIVELNLIKYKCLL